jgi:hypothetical protein
MPPMMPPHMSGQMAGGKKPSGMMPKKEPSQRELMMSIAGGAEEAPPDAPSTGVDDGKISQMISQAGSLLAAIGQAKPELAEAVQNAIGALKGGMEEMMAGGPQPEGPPRGKKPPMEDEEEMVS